MYYIYIYIYIHTYYIYIYIYIYIPDRHGVGGANGSRAHLDGLQELVLVDFCIIITDIYIYIYIYREREI